jgi:hypothetical protein
MSLFSGIFNTLFLTFAHNQYALAFFIGCVLSFALLILRPSRYAVFLLLGFTILLLGFEYDKHIVAPLEEQTLASLDFEGSRANFFVSLGFKKLLPFFFFFCGWGSLFFALIYAGIKKEDYR